MLEKALAKWEAMAPAERDITDEQLGKGGLNLRLEQMYPADGLALRVIARDLERPDAKADWRRNSWNQDFAWFKKDETRQLLPAELAKGAKADVPEDLIRRLARCQFVDDVRGQTTSFPTQSVESARLTVEVADVQGSIVTLRLEGATRTVQKGRWAVRGFEDMHKPGRHERGMDLKLLGSAAWDSAKERFTAFELVAQGTRWGATQYNGRGDDMDPAPIAFVLTLGGDKPADRVAPAHIWEYGWK